MKKVLPLLFSILLFACNTPNKEEPVWSPTKKEYPHDFMFMQRAYPTGKIKTEAYKEAIQWKRQQTRLGGGELWEFVGPVNIGGRITDIEIPVDDEQTYYVGAASGGVFKTENAGTNWTPIFDEQEMLSIGDIAISKNNTSLVWVGTGEVNAGGGSLAYDGDGIYKSTDGGENWEVKGLPDVGSISKIVMDPNNDEVVFVGAMGPLFKNGTNRGVYRSLDGGNTWEQKLFVSDSTGIIDMVIHPSNGDILYAAAWERIRRPQYRQYGGETSGIYRSLDGGENWTELTSGLPGLPSEKGRISLAISESNPNVLYARYADAVGNIQGVYRSSNGGNTWVARNSASLTNIGFHWWFRGIVVDPTDEDIIYNVDFNVQKSTDGGNTWFNSFSGVHVDQHILTFNPNDNQEVLLGNDGGFYKSTNGGTSWTKDEALPITQFYRIFVNNDFEVYGGAQDNSTMRTLTGSEDDWEIIYQGDGFQPLVDPNNGNIIYALYQYGNIGKSTNGGNSFVNATTGISGSDRKNWDTPLTFDPQDSQILYTGTQRVYKTTNATGNWTPISPDLTDGDAGGNLNFGTITSISVSPADQNLIYAGTDDGNVWRTNDGGSNWINISDDLPNRWVTKVEAHPFDENTVFVSFSGYRYGENEGHVFRSNDKGSSWQDITDNMPDIPINDLEYIGSDIEGLYMATDVGVFYSANATGNWQPFGMEMPSLVVTDLATSHNNPNTDYLYAATYGRSIYRTQVGVLGVSNLDFLENITLFPNPASERVHVQFNQVLEGRVEVCNLSGALLSSEEISEKEKILSVSHLSEGIYFVSVISGNEKVTKKLIVK